MKRLNLLAVGLTLSFLSQATAQNARQILDATGVRGGLIVVIGSDDPTLASEFLESGSFLVHCLQRDPDKVRATRGYLCRKGLQGPISAAQWNGTDLPYVENLVKMVILAADAGRVSRDEIMRVLAPGGVMVSLKPSAAGIHPLTKPWPAKFDQWGHFLHDASNNAVSKDVEVGPPQGLRWTCGPEFARSHEHLASMSGMVTANGRVFYIIDEGPISSVYLPPKWKLVARDAFSGVLLWDRPITNWEARLRGFRSGPPEIGRRMVAGDDRLYVALGYGDPVSVLDAATGKRLATIAGTLGARELLLQGNTLYVLADDMVTAQHNKRRDDINREFLQTSRELVIWQRLPRKAFPIYGLQRIVAAGIESAKSMWEHRFQTPGEVMPTTMAVDAGRVCLQTVSHIVCLDAASGQELWRHERPVARSRYSWSAPTLVIHDGVVLSLDRSERDGADKSPPASGSKWLMNSGLGDLRQGAQIVTLSLADGHELWRADYSENYNTPGDIFVIDGVVWIGNLRRGVDPGFTHGRDLQTGKVTAEIPPQKAWGHHRCYRNKATVRYLMVGRGGVQFIDLETGEAKSDSWFRGTCQFGTMPANGLMYVPQHSCACQPEELLKGLNVLAPTSSAGEGSPPLERGPAFGDVSIKDARSDGLDLARKSDWPTYRGDVRRSGFRDLSAPNEPEIAWTENLVAPITAPVVERERLYVAEIDRHSLHALSAVDGRRVWTFVADGRIDSPPTLSAGRCLFGTRSGYVYCLQATTGALIWRFRAAPRDRRVFAYEQLESAWPVHGSVLVDNTVPNGPSTVYFAAGRSSRLDGGIRLYAVSVETGQLLHHADVAMRRGPDEHLIRQSVLPDVLSLQDGTIWMRGLGVDKDLAPVSDRPHLFAPRGFLDDTWWHRTYWIYGSKMGGGYSHWPDTGNTVPAGRLLVFDDGPHIYGYGRLHYRMGDGHVGPDAAKDYKLFAEVRAPRKETRRNARGEPVQTQGRRQIVWTSQPPFVVRSIVLARNALLLAGGRSLTESATQHGPGSFWIVSRADGSKISEFTLPAPPVIDGMAFTNSGLFISGLDGSLTCLRTRKRK